MELARASEELTTVPTDPAARDELARTIARVGGRDAASQLLAMLAAQPEPSPAFMAAIGLLEPQPDRPGEAPSPRGAWAGLEQALWLHYALDESSVRMRATSFALARIGGVASQAGFAAEIAASDDDDARRGAVFDAIGILCARRVPLQGDALPGLAQALEHGAPAVRQAALAALARCVPPSAEAFAGDERAAWVQRLERIVAADDDESARLAWRAFAALGEAPAAIPASILAMPAPAWTVEVEAVRALAASEATRSELVERLAKLPLDQQVGTRVNVVWVALSSLRRAADAMPSSIASLQPLRRALASARAELPRRRFELAILRCEAEVLAAIADGSLATLGTCARDDRELVAPSYAAALSVEALAAMGRASAMRVRADGLMELAVDERPGVAAAALSALADLEDPRVNPLLREALLRADAGVLAAAAGAIAARAADRGRRDPEAVPALEALVGRADARDTLEARLAAVEALGALARSTGAAVGELQRDGAAIPKLAMDGDDARAWLQRAVVPLAADHHDAVRRAAWLALAGHDDLRAAFALAVPRRFDHGFAPEVEAAAAAAGAEAVAGLRVHTGAGVFEISFDGSPAPIARANLVALARAGYFDGLRFHRVVPGFVVQGGDPRGDGYGGPGWVVPCEWSELRYERGTVGIALAGKDTGGSQFFVTHTRQPHLDGRFPVVGRVREGMEVVDALLPQDVIERVEVVPAAVPSP